jgi:hypothetical protein
MAAAEAYGLTIMMPGMWLVRETEAGGEAAS